MKLKQYYKLYCKILINGLKEAKKNMIIMNKIVNSHNKVKITWIVIKK